MIEEVHDLSGCDLSGCDLSGCDVSGNEVVYTGVSEEQSIVENNWGLRIRTRFDEFNTTLPNQLTQYTPPQLHLNQLYLDGMVYLFRFLNVTGQFLSFLWLLFGNIGKGVKRAVQDDIYVFFKGSSHPYFINDVQLNGSGTPEVEWYYNATTHTFVTARLFNTSQTYPTHHIPYLTAEVKYNDLILHDVSEFINSVKWAGMDDAGGHQKEAMPNVDHLISAWSISSGIVLKRSSHMNLFVINTDGEEVKLPLRNGA